MEQLTRKSVRRMRQSWAGSIAFLIGLWVALCVAILVHPANANEDSMRLAAHWLARVQLPSGLFLYTVDLETGESADMSTITPQNMVRQAGTAYALSEYFRHSSDERLRTVLESAIEAFAARSLPVGRGWLQARLESSGILSFWRVQQNLSEPLDWLGLLYTPEGDGKLVSPDGTYESAWLGATALALVTELSYRRATGDDRFAAVRHEWLRGILNLHVFGRGFRAAPNVLFEHHYFNGESWFALASYVRMFPEDEATAAVLEEVDAYMLDRYGSKPSLLFYHWGSMAAEQRYWSSHDRRFFDFLTQQATVYLDELQPATNLEHVTTCASLEGLATAERVHRTAPEGHTALLGRLRARIDQEVQHNLSLQIRDDQKQPALAGDRVIPPSLLDENIGGFLISRQKPVLQIDVTGHCLSALLRLTEPGPATLAE